MKTTIKVLSAIVLVTLTSTAFKLADYTELEIGKAIPSADVKMMDISGKEISLADAKGENGLLVIFSCNTCPYVKLSETRIKELSKPICSHAFTFASTYVFDPPSFPTKIATK